MLNRIVYAVDFTDLQSLAVPCLARLGIAGCGELIFLHVTDEKRFLGGVPSLLRYELRGCLVEAARRKIMEWARTCEQSDTAVRTVVSQGGAGWTDLCEAVSRENASLVVLGPRVGPDAGPTAYFLMHAVGTSVLLLKVADLSLPEPFGKGCTDLFSRVLIPTDWSESALRAQENVSRLASAGIEEVILLHVLEPDESETINEKKRSLASRRLARSQADLQEEGIKAKTLLREGDPASAIISSAGEREASLIMMGSTGKSVTEEMLIGSISEHVALTADRSVLLVH